MTESSTHLTAKTRPLRILLCHNRYQLAGGEDGVVAMESQLLRDHGHNVRLHEVTNDAIVKWLDKVRAGWHAAWSEQAKAELAEILQEFCPDIVHVHNFFPLLTPAVYAACRAQSIPVVQTLHNYRIICPGAMLMRNGTVCELCVTGSPLHGAWHGCYRNSRLQSLAVARMVAYHRRHDTWNRQPSRLIALTGFARNKFVEAGIAPDQIVVKPNFVALPEESAATAQFPRQDFALYVGRISAEKGIHTLITAFNQTGLPLKIAGSGPLEVQLKACSTDNIEWLGQQSPQQVAALMQQARFLVMPSQWYEGFPLVLLEAFANALPVLCSRLGSMAEIVADSITGIHFTAGDVADLAEKSRSLHDNPAECARMGANARLEFLARYTPAENYRMLMNIYREALDATP